MGLVYRISGLSDYPDPRLSDDKRQRDAAKAPSTPNDTIMDQFATYLARLSGLVKISDDGNKVTYGKPSSQPEMRSTSAQRLCVRQGGGLRAGLRSTRR